jgi:hypothetical protein
MVYYKQSISNSDHLLKTILFFIYSSTLDFFSFMHFIGSTVLISPACVLLNMHTAIVTASQYIFTLK